MRKFAPVPAVLLAFVAVAAMAVPMSKLEGKPKLEIGDAFGYFLWHDKDGVHLRWTTKEKERAFSGNVTANGELKDLKRVKAEGDDWIKRTGPNSFAFTTKTKEGVDGVDFRYEGPSMKLTLEVDGHPIPVQHIHVGSTSMHPKHNPFPVERKP